MDIKNENNNFISCLIVLHTLQQCPKLLRVLTMKSPIPIPKSPQ